jgi:hypothetical protein
MEITDLRTLSNAELSRQLDEVCQRNLMRLRYSLAPRGVADTLRGIPENQGFAKWLVDSDGGRRDIPLDGAEGGTPQSTLGLHPSSPPGVRSEPTRNQNDFTGGEI